MKRSVFLLAMLLCVSYIKAQVKSSHDGFYTADSVFYKLSSSDSFKYCINCYTPDSLKKYTGGIWLHSREKVPNTWENSRFSNNKNLPDTGVVRADVVKANTIWVRVYKNGGYIDEHHFVFLGKWKPKAAQVISLLIDSSDFMGPNGFYGPGEGMLKNAGVKWNYRLKIEKKCTYQIFAGNHLQPEAGQQAGVEISAQESADYPDKAIQLNADKGLGKKEGLVLGKSLTDLLGADIKTLRLRLGGSNHRSSITANEIATGIIRPDLGGTPSTPICVFINGSLWTYALAQEGMGANRVSKFMNAPNLITAKVPPVLAVPDIKKLGLVFNLLGGSAYAVCGLLNVCPVFYVYHDTLQFHIDSTDINHSADFEKLCVAVYTGSDSVIASAINRESFYRYALAIWFFQNPDSWGNHLTIAKSAAEPWRLFGEHFDFGADSANVSDWNKYFTKYAGGRREGLPWQATKKMLRYDKDNFCLVLEDELNTTYNPERTVTIAQQKISSLRPCVNECSKAWYPNDWPDSASWEYAVSNIIPFLLQRPNAVTAALPKIFLSGADTSLRLSDLHTVSVKFNQVPGKGVVVKLNSLDLNTDFTGKYYPHPNLHISLVYDPAKYEFVKWLEYPDSPAAFTLSANKPVILTPVFKLKGN